MNADPKWRSLGWQHPLWDLVRFYLSLRHSVPRAEWLERLETTKTLSVEANRSFQIDPDHVDMFFEYLAQRETDFATGFAYLRTEDEALSFCDKKGISVGKTATKSQDHYQSSKAMVATVTDLAEKVCVKAGSSITPSPQRRCVWCVENGLHVSARNIDGAIPSLANPTIIWEIKEYWGGTKPGQKGGSKMSDAVYECNLVGRELRDFEDRTDFKVVHLVFVDGKSQWTARPSDFKRFIDLMNQGLIDHLIVGKEVEAHWPELLLSLLRRV